MSRAIAGVLRVGTLIAVAAIGLGLILALAAGDPGHGPVPVIDLFAGSPADALLGAGLLILTATPVAALGVAGVLLWRADERRHALFALVALALLGASLALGLLISGPS